MAASVIAASAAALSSPVGGEAEPSTQAIENARFSPENGAPEWAAGDEPASGYPPGSALYCGKTGNRHTMNK